jgi:predicted nucleic acid-binding Zn ribbon protein
MPVEIAQHGHCQVCGRVVRYGKPYCSEECQSELERMKKSRKRTMMIMYGLLILVFVVFILLPLLGGGG